MFKATIAATALMFTSVAAHSGTIQTKPVLCGTPEENLDDKTYSILEYHPEYKQYCLISFGSEGKFVNE